jgi:energy-coupling factor transporter ATP-binding protein EcfA2
MLVRLVFSMFACFNPEVFIVDEALSVGDVHFQQKCARRIRQMLAQGVTMLFVSHDLVTVEALCDRVMVLNGGEVKFLGDKSLGISHYYALIGASMPGPSARSIRSPVQRASADKGADAVGIAGVDDLAWQFPDQSDATGAGKVRITGIAFRAPDGQATPVISRGRWIDIFVRYQAVEDIGPMSAGVTVYDRMDQLLFAVNWMNAQLEPIWLDKGQEAVGVFSIKAELEPGEYILALGASQALPDPQSPTGWNQHIGGERLGGLPHAAKLAVLPPVDNRRSSFGPANLEYSLRRAVSPVAAQPQVPGSS